MKRRASVSNDEVIIAEIRDNPEFAAAYLAAAMESTDQPGVLLIATAQEKDTGFISHGVIHTIARPHIDPQFPNSVPDGLMVAKISQRQPGEPRNDSRLGVLIA